MTLREVGGERGAIEGAIRSPLKGRGAIDGTMSLHLMEGGCRGHHRSPFKGRGAIVGVIGLHLRGGGYRGHHGSPFKGKVGYKRHYESPF